MIQYQPYDDALDDVMVQDPMGEYVRTEDAEEQFEGYRAEIADWKDMYDRLEAQLEERTNRCVELEKAMKEIRAYADV